MKTYKGYEIYFDDCYYGMTAVRPIGCKDFNKTQHVDDEYAAKRYVDSILNERILASPLCPNCEKHEHNIPMANDTYFCKRCGIRWAK